MAAGDRGDGHVTPTQELARLREYLLRRCDDLDRVAFDFVAGDHFEGWIVEVGQSHAVIGWAPSPFYAQAQGTEEMSPPDEPVPFEAILSRSLARYDTQLSRWVEFPE